MVASASDERRGTRASADLRAKDGYVPQHDPGEDIWEEKVDPGDKYNDGDKIWYTGSINNLYENVPGVKPGKSYFDSATLGKAVSSGKAYNFVNERDWALASWWTNNRLLPDDGGFLSDYEYSTIEGFKEDRLWPLTDMALDIRKPEDRWNIFAYCLESRTRSLGATLGVGGVFNSDVNLSESPCKGYDDTHPGHSKQFRGFIQEQITYWEEVRSRCWLQPLHR